MAVLLLDRFGDGLEVARAPRLGGDLDPEIVGETRHDLPLVHRPLEAQHRMAGGRVLFQPQHRIGLAEPRQRRRQPHLVALVRRRDDPRERGRRPPAPVRHLRGGGHAEHPPGIELIGLDRYPDLARLQVILAGLAAGLRDAAEPVARQLRPGFGADIQSAQEDAFAEMLADLRVEPDRDRIRRAEPLPERRDGGGFVPKRLHQPQDAVAAAGRP